MPRNSFQDTAQLHNLGTNQWCRLFFGGLDTANWARVCNEMHSVEPL